MYVLAVEGMKESGREADVIRFIKAIDGSAEVSVDLLSETVKVQSSARQGGPFAIEKFRRRP